MEFQALCGLKTDGRASMDTLIRLYADDAPQWDGVKRTASATQCSSSKVSADKMLDFAQSLVGKPYAYGACGPLSFDASGFVCHVLKFAGITAHGQGAASSSRMKSWTKINSLETLMPGDLLFFINDGHRISHTGIYIGLNRMIHAVFGQGVPVMPIDKHYADRFAFARRIF